LIFEDIKKKEKYKIEISEKTLKILIQRPNFIYFTSKGIINYKITVRNAVAGNIGSGKTTLTRYCSTLSGTSFRDVVDNPIWMIFIHQMERWSFNLQIYFLNSRFVR
jgi:hypothetical protein